MNGLVRVCSLNRKSPVHKVCCNAIELLGYKKLASVLRQSLAVVEVKESSERPGYLQVHIKRAYWNYSLSKDLYSINGWARSQKGILIQNHDGKSWSWDGGKKVSNRKLLWNILVKHLSGMIVKTDKGCFEINDKPKKSVSI